MTRVKDHDAPDWFEKYREILKTRTKNNYRRSYVAIDIAVEIAFKACTLFFFFRTIIS